MSEKKNNEMPVVYATGSFTGMNEKNNEMPVVYGTGSFTVTDADGWLIGPSGKTIPELWMTDEAKADMLKRRELAEKVTKENEDLKKQVAELQAKVDGMNAATEHLTQAYENLNRQHADLQKRVVLAMDTSLTLLGIKLGG